MSERKGERLPAAVASEREKLPAAASDECEREITVVKERDREITGSLRFTKARAGHKEMGSLRGRTQNSCQNEN